MSTSLSIKGKTQGNEAVTSTINYVNPNATNAQLVSLATAMNNLTTNTVADITRIDKNSLTNTIEKQARNLQLSSTELQVDEISQATDQPTEVTLTGAAFDAKDLQVQLTDEVSPGLCFISWRGEDGEAVISLCCNSTDIAYTQVVFSLPEDSVYQAAAVTLSIG